MILTNFHLPIRSNAEADLRIFAAIRYKQIDSFGVAISNTLYRSPLLVTFSPPLQPNLNVILGSSVVSDPESPLKHIHDIHKAMQKQFEYSAVSAR